MHTFDKKQLSEKIGTLSAERVQQIINGVGLVIEPREV